MWVRGLKRIFISTFADVEEVAPYVGAWIETSSRRHEVLLFLSHPMWVRGLKLLWQNITEHVEGVAPYVGAWIETLWYAL